MQGFTLLEMMLVMFVLMVLVGAIAAIVRGTILLTDEMTQAQNKDSRLNAFAQLCERTFRGLPAQAMVRLRNTQAGNRYLYQLALVDAPSPLNAGGLAGDVTVFETEEAPDGYLRIFLRSMSAEQALAWENGETDVGVRLPLLENVAALDWAFYNPQSAAWEPLWNESYLLPLNAGVLEGLPPTPADNVEDPPASADTDAARRTLASNAASQLRAMQRGMRPGLVEMKIAVGADPPLRWVFWVPPLKAK